MKTNDKQVLDGQQLELTFDGAAAFEPAMRRGISAARAAWWFGQIHTRLRNALRPPPPARPEQGRLAFATRG